MATRKTSAAQDAAVQADAPVSLVSLASTLDHPVVLSYDGDALTLPPRGRVSNVDPAKLGALPKGVVVG